MMKILGYTMHHLLLLTGLEQMILARDIFVRVWEGARISLFIGITAAIIDLIIGVLWGSIAGLVWWTRR